MTISLTRRGWLGALGAGLLAWAGLRPGGRAPAAPAGCPHPIHRPLCADRPGPDAPGWGRTRLWLVCPRCGQTAYHEGYLPGPCHAWSELAAPPGPDYGTQTYTESYLEIHSESFSSGGPSPGAGSLR